MIFVEIYVLFRAAGTRCPEIVFDENDHLSCYHPVMNQGRPKETTWLSKQ